MIRFVLGILFSCLLFTAAWAEEKITSYDALMDVQQDGDVIITESITLIKEGIRINRGIIRDFPRFHLVDERKLPLKYEVLSVKRNGIVEPYSDSKDGNSLSVRIGDANVILKNGQHTYEIKYEIKNVVRYFDDYDEVYWNVTGTFWTFPIEKVNAEIKLPEGSVFIQKDASTGFLGVEGKDYSFQQMGDRYVFETQKELKRLEGLTVAVGFEKGLIDPPSQADMRSLWWMQNGALLLLSISFLGIVGYYLRAWNKVGRDPQKKPVFARYGPPDGYSAAAIHRVFYRGLRGHKALISTLLSLSIKGWIDLEAGKKETVITPIKRVNAPRLLPEEADLYNRLFGTGGNAITLKDKYNSRFTSAYNKFRSKLSKNYGKDYHRYNIGYILLGILLTAGAFILAASQIAGQIAGAFIWILLALIAANILFMFLMPAPTRKGQDIKTEIEGFKLYLKTAEELRLNAAKPGTEQPPPMTKERYEAFLPYAVALSVEKPWTKHFENVLPEEAANYNPSYARAGSGNYGSIGGLNKAIVSNVSSGVSRSMPQSSSSSGSGGGSFSGGGSGGGGGSGW